LPRQCYDQKKSKNVQLQKIVPEEKPMPTDPSRFFTDLFTGYRRTRCLTVAGRLGVFEGLKTGGSSAENLATRLGCDSLRLRGLLEGLTAMELLEHTDGTFSLTPFAAHYLLPPGVGHGVLRYQHRMWEAWASLEDGVRSGDPWRELVDLLENDADFRDGYLQGVAALSGPTRAVANRLAAERPRAILDLGGGSGTFAVAMAEEIPDAQVTLFDLPTSQGMAADKIAASAAGKRVSFRAGDYLRDSYGGGYDLILMSHTTHDEGPESVAAMFRRAYEALEPGGQIAVHDWVVDDDRTGPEHAVMFSLNLMLYTKSGRIYSRAEYGELFAGAGLTDVRAEDVLADVVANPTTLLLARKP
jgi:SAM-dependent methyltransferase